MSRDEIAEQADAVITDAIQRGCERRFGDDGYELKPRHIYLDHSGRCQCGNGPDLSLQRLK